MPRDKLSKLLEQQLKKNDLTLYRIGLETGISYGTLYGLFNDERKFKSLSLANAIKICNVLNCNLSDLIEDEYYQIALEYDKRRHP